jgi:hypothetical protein
MLFVFVCAGVGGYTDSRGNSAIREEVADFIQRRDGHRPDSEVSLYRTSWQCKEMLCIGMHVQAHAQ